jgi:hypothetical protein
MRAQIKKGGMVMTECNKCPARKTCPFYDAESDECVYEVLAEAAQIKKGDTNHDDLQRAY